MTGVNGLLVPVGDVDAVAAAIARILDGRGLRERLAARLARHRSSTSRSTRVYGRLEAILRDVAHG